MNSDATPQNAWVDSYLNALLTYGLSSEYTAKSKGTQSKRAPDADRSAYNRFYVQSLLNLDEDALSTAYFKASSGSRAGDDKDSRLGYLSWRIWFLKRRRAMVERDRAAAALHEEESHGHLVDSSDDETPSPAPAKAPGLNAAGLGPAPRRVASHSALSSLEDSASVAERWESQTRPGANGPASALGAAAPHRQHRRRVEGGESAPGGPLSPSHAPGLPSLHAAAALGVSGAALKPRKPALSQASRAPGSPEAPRGLRRVRIGSAEISERTAEWEAAEEGVASNLDGVDSEFSAEHELGSLYVVMISLHGLVRGDAMELGKDSDTGGQVKYVVELARTMALHPAVHRVDLLTRQILDPGVDASYGEAEECLSRGSGTTGGAFIVRLPCGPSESYIRKELLWAHVPEFADRAVAHVDATLAACAEEGKRARLFVVHGHYADAGEVAVRVSCTLDVPMLATGHSLGRNKLEHLLAVGAMTRAQMEEAYTISRRVEAEERCLDAASIVFTSTQQEVDEQWGLYDGYQPQLARVLHFRRALGRHMPHLCVLPPGLDFSSLKVDIPADPVLREFDRQRARLETRALNALSPTASAVAEQAREAAPEEAAEADEGDKAGGASSPQPPNSALDPRVALIPKGPRVWQDVARFLRNPLKPAVLAMSRPDPKKNLATLVRAFGESPMLRELSNLVLVMGNRDAIDSMAGGSQKVLLQVLKLIDYYDLHGSVAYPKHHEQSDISDIYRFATATRGVFTNVALQEPFGLTVIEAAAHGAPTVATCNGGPVDIMATLHHGVTVDPQDSSAIAAALLGILTSPPTWDAMSEAGVANIMAYSWPSHCKRYVAAVDAELRHQRACRRQDRTLSGMLDSRRPGARRAELAMPPAPSRSARAGRGDQQPSSATADYAASVDTFFAPSRREAGDAAAPPVRHAASGLSADDLALLSQLNTDSLASQTAAAPAGAGRRRLFALALDGERCAPRCAALMAAWARGAGRKKREEEQEKRKEGEGKEESLASAPVGLVLLSMLGFESTIAALEKQGADCSQLDYCVCNAGADAWYRTARGSWAVDEAYERLIEFQWDRTALHRTLRKVISRGAHRQAGLPRLKELLYDVAEAPATGVHPRHVCIELDAETQDILSAGMNPATRQQRAGRMAQTCTQRLRRRLRSKGFRAAYTLQVLPAADVQHGGCDSVVRSSVLPARSAPTLESSLSSAGDRPLQTSLSSAWSGLPPAGPALQPLPSSFGAAAEAAAPAPSRDAADGGRRDHLSILHITPLRATRALGLRALARRLEVPLERVTVVLPVVASRGGSPAAAVAGHVADLAELAAGVPGVLLLQPEPEAGEPEPERGPDRELLLDQCGVDLAPWLACGDRLEMLLDGGLEERVRSLVRE